MAKYTHTGLLNGIFLEDPYSDSSFSLKVDPDGERAVFTGDDFGMKIVLTGQNLTGTDELTAGTVTGVSFKDDSGGVFATAVDIKLSAAKLSDALTEQGGFQFIKTVLNQDDMVVGSDGDDVLFSFAGDDRIFGRKGDDWLNGSAGHDILTGGRGSDIFLFAGAYGYDVITDFDAVGGGNKQDYLFIRDEVMDDFQMKENRNGDAVLVFDTGAKLTLEGVSVSQLDDGDFL
jgi:Ca2+-binding RTX toxin-like protein